MEVFTTLKWAVLALFRRTMELLPRCVVVRIGGALGLLLWALSGKRVKEAEGRCARALNASPARARTIVRGSYANLGRSALEFISIGGASSIASLVELHGEEHLRRAFDKRRGVILFSGHIGNWEYGAALLSELGYPMNAIGADQREDRMTGLIKELRSVSGVKSVGKGLDLKAAMRCLKNGELLAVLIDQDVRERGVFVPFLGIPASTPFGIAKIARKLGSAILPSIMIRRGTSAMHDLYIMPSPWENGLPPEYESMETAMTRCNDLLGDSIRESPEQWMWLYPRWATQPGD